MKFSCRGVFSTLLVDGSLMPHFSGSTFITRKVCGVLFHKIVHLRVPI